MQFNSLMASIIRHRIQQRVAGVYDTAHGAQATVKSITEYTRKMERSVDLHKDQAGSSSDFLRDFNRGSA